MNKNYIRLSFFENVSHSSKDTRCNIIQILALLHDIEIVIWSNLEQIEHLIKHLTVLASNADNCLKFIRIFLELLY